MEFGKNSVKQFFQKNFLFFCLTLPAFHVLHRYNEYFGLLSFSQAMLHFIIYAVCFFVLYLLLKKIFQQRGKAAWFTICLMIIFFFFGAFHDGIRKTSLPASIISYKIILPLLTVIVLLLFFYIKKEKQFSVNRIFFFNLLFALFFIYELIALPVNFFRKNESKNDYNKNESLALVPVQTASASMPDIYFVVLDEYTSSDCLREEFNFDNSGFDSSLLANHFFISRRSNSNYNITPFSVSSTLNLNYLKDELNNKSLTGKLLLQGVYSLQHAWLPAFLQQQGYTIKNYSLFNLEDYPAAHTAYFEYIRDEVNAVPTLLGNIRRDIWWNTAKLHLNSSEAGNSDVQIHTSNNQFNYDRLKKEFMLNEAAPKFVYCHLMIPHEAFLLDKNGKLLPDSVRRKTSIKSLYLGQLEYVNSLFEQLLPAISKAGERPRVIVLEGDHGFKFYQYLSNKKNAFRNLNTYYFSDGNYTGLYDGISPVNSFRIILNKYFNQHLSLLPDSSVFINDTSPLIMD